MINFFKNNYILKKSLYTLGIILIAIIFYRFTENVKISAIVPFIYDMLTPFIYGAVMAYLLNIAINFLERRLFVRLKIFQGNSPKTHRHKRLASVLISIILLISAIIAIVSYIIPEIISSGQNIVNVATNFNYSAIKQWANNIINDFHIPPDSEAYKTIINSINTLIETITQWFSRMPELVLSLLESTIKFASSMGNVIIGFIIAFYLLMDKEKVVLFCKKLIFTILPKEKAILIINNVKLINKTFNSFFSGKTLDSLIIGIIFFIGAIILRIPYPLLFSIIIAITNMIPYFGPFIGAIPVTLLTLLVNPFKALWVIIYIIILQQFDGVILGPKILGNSIGMKPICVIFAIIVGGTLAGPLGMFFATPIFACLFKIFFRHIDNVYNSKYNVNTKESD